MRTSENLYPAVRFAFTKSKIESLPWALDGQVYYRDTMLRGFGLRVGTSSKVYFAEGQVNRITRRVTIGRADVFSPDVARKKALAILGEMADGTDPNQAKREQIAEKITIKEAFDAFFGAKPHLAACTVDAYRRTCNLYLEDWQKKPMTEITRQMVLSRHQKVSIKYGAITANNVFRHFRSVYNFTAASFDEFPANPVVILTQARAWHRETRRRRVITVHDLPHWWQAIMAETEDARDIFLIALFTGMRRSEILRLQWEHVDLVAKTLHLPTTKNGDPLDLPLSDFLVGVIDNRRGKPGQSPWLFPSYGETGHITEIKSFVCRVVEKSGIPFSMHDLRRTFITIAESLDIPAYALKRLLNHRADTDITGGYIVINAERLRGPVERIAKKILILVKST